MRGQIANGHKLAERLNAEHERHRNTKAALREQAASRHDDVRARLAELESEARVLTFVIDSK